MKRGVKDSNLKGAKARFATTRVYWSFLKQNRGYIFFHTFLRIFLRKINILKKPKLHPTELSKVYGMNNK